MAPDARSLIRRLKRIRAVSAGLTLAEDWAIRARARVDPNRSTPRNPVLSSQQRDLLVPLLRDGYVVIDGYWDQARCASARQAIDDHIQRHPDRVWRCPMGADHRLHGFDRVHAATQALFRDPMLHGVAEAVAGHRVVNGFTLGARLDATPGNLGSGQGWHRDGITQYVKALLYLSDVDADHGPFQLVRHTRTLREQVSRILESGLQFRQIAFTDADIMRLERRHPGSVTTFTGSAGTLVLALTRHIHRGKPIARGHRYALTNYYFSESSVGPALADYYDRQVTFADGGSFDVDTVRAFEPSHRSS